MRTRLELAADTDPDRVRGWGSLRRMAISLTLKALWQLVGFTLPDGSVETFTADAFTGIGFYARPPANGKPEAIAAMVGGAQSPVIVATRDEATRAAVAGALAQDETMAFNSQAVVYVKADGTVEVRSATGAAVALALKSDVASAVSTFNAHTHIAAGVSSGIVAVTTAPPATPAAAPTGTTVLKGQ